MNISERYAEQFRSLYESFRTGCDSLEEMGLWDKESLGEMEVFYLNDLTAVILRLIASDGVVSRKEAEFVNLAFDLNYSVSELQAVYENCRDYIGASFEELFAGGVGMLKKINPRLAEAYRRLLSLVCAAVAESDGVVSPQEAAEAAKWQARFDKEEI